MTTQKQVADIKKNFRSLKTVYDRVFASPDGQLIMADLEARFGGTTLKKVEKVIDPHASIAAAGCREVLLYIQQMRITHAVD